MKMSIPKKQLLFLSLIVLCASAKSQDYFTPEGSFSVDLGIPAKGKNVAFGTVMEGLFNGGLTYQYNVLGGLTLGAGMKYSFFIMNPYALNNAQWNASLHIPAAYIKLGYERFTTERISFNASVRSGYSVIAAVHGNDSIAEGTTKNLVESSFFVEPQLELVLLTDKSSSDGFSLVLGYSFYFNEFGPRYLGLNHFQGLDKEHSEGITRFFSFGFGYRYYMGRK